MTLIFGCSIALRPPCQLIFCIMITYNFAKSNTLYVVFICKKLQLQYLFKSEKQSIKAKKKCHCKPLSAAKITALPNFEVVCNDIFLFSLFPFKRKPNRHGFNGNFYFFRRKHSSQRTTCPLIETSRLSSLA